MQHSFSTYTTNKQIKHAAILKLINRLGIDCRQAIKLLAAKDQRLFTPKRELDNYDYENMYLQ